ncbi:MAG: hypothetical protein ACI4JW_08575 [Oscillospiraceae bacterium]
MYTVRNQAVAEKIMSDCRTWRIWLENTETGAAVMGDHIMDADSQQNSTSLSDDIELGAVCAQSWTVNVTGTTENFVGKEYRLYFYLKDFTHGTTTYGDLKTYTCGALKGLTIAQIKTLGEVLEGELIPMGVFTCVKAPRSGDGRQLVLYDKLYFADRVYERKVSMPAYASDIEKDVCRQLGMGCKGSSISGDLHDSEGAALIGSDGLRLRAASYDFTISKIAAGTTCRQMLSYIASARGHFGTVDRSGAYMTRWYTKCGYTVSGDTADEPTVSEKPNQIVGIVCKVSESTTLSKIVNDGKGRILEFENPYMNKSLLESLFSRIRNYTWYTSQLHHRLGDPRLDIGDVVSCEDCEIPVTGLAFSYDGGLSADISAVGLNEEEQII